MKTKVLSKLCLILLLLILAEYIITKGKRHGGDKDKKRDKKAKKKYIAVGGDGKHAFYLKMTYDQKHRKCSKNRSRKTCNSNWNCCYLEYEDPNYGESLPYCLD